MHSWLGTSKNRSHGKTQCIERLSLGDGGVPVSLHHGILIWSAVLIVGGYVAVLLASRVDRIMMRRTDLNFEFILGIGGIFVMFGGVALLLFAD